MELYYSEHQSQLSPVELLEPGRLYAAPFDGEWIRVELVSYPEEGKVIEISFPSLAFLPDILIRYIGRE